MQIHHALIRAARRARGLLTVALATGLLPAVPAAASASPVPDGGAPVSTTPMFLSVPEQATPAATEQLRGLVGRVLEAVGATTVRRFDIAGSFVADVPNGHVAALRAALPVVGGCATAIGPAQRFVFGPSYRDAAGDDFSLPSIARAMGADAFTRHGFRGQGVDVAVIDTGVAEVGPFAPGSGRLLYGPDLSFDAAVPALRHRDAFGHGTHMAGIVNAIAPDARVVSLKVGDLTGAVDVTQVIAAIDWVREHRRDHGLDIRVVNLSFGVESANVWTSDELSLAVDAAWAEGLVVVVAGGNGGRAAAKTDPGLLTPAINRNVIAVGAYDSGSPLTRGDDTVAGFTSGASSANKRMPDVVAPGRSIESLRVPGSAADEQITERLCAGGTAEPHPVVDAAHVRGSGSSQAAAAASGAVALLLSYRTGLTNDQVKAMLRKHAAPVRQGRTAAGREVVGEGAIDLAALLWAAPPRAGRQSRAVVVGGGSLDGTRFGEHLRRGEAIPTTAGVPTGDVDIFGTPFSTARHAALLRSGRPTWVTSPAGQLWMGALPTGAPPAGGTLEPGLAGAWGAAPWPPRSWSGAAWPSEVDFEGMRWRSGAWSGLRWRAAGWSGMRWRDAGWSGMRWRDAAWADSAW